MIVPPETTEERFINVSSDEPELDPTSEEHQRPSVGTQPDAPPPRQEVNPEV